MNVVSGQPSRLWVRARRAPLVVICLAACWTSTAGAQPPSPAAAADATWSIAAGYEVHRDRFRYEFENPSSIDTPFLVPHSFAQTYVADNRWLVGSVRYRVFGERLESEVGVTPRITTPASDIDTFYNPDNDTVTSGSVGEALMRSFRFAQWSESQLSGLTFRVGYQYRRDQSDFLPADIVVTHTHPPSEARRFTTDREYTTSRVQAAVVDLSKPTVRSRRWTVTLGAGISPIVLARLTTRLPDKYPEPIVADARAIEIAGRALVTREGRWAVLFGMEWGKTWSYKASRQFNRDALQVLLRVAYRP